MEVEQLELFHNQLQMEQMEDQVVVVLGVLQVQDLLVSVVVVTHLQQLQPKEQMDQEDNIMVQHTRFQEVEVVQEVQHQYLVQEVVVQQVMERRMEE